MATKVIIYHNPRCRKSREALQVLENKGCEITIVEYLKDIPSVAELKQLCQKLGMNPDEIIRKGEAIYKSEFKGKVLSSAEWLKVLAAKPVLIERPIVIKGDKAVIARESGILTKFLK
jgi:arsenate reductase (glutaredoxin)